MPAEAVRFSPETAPRADSQQPVAITQHAIARVESLAREFRLLDADLRRRFGDGSYSVERSEQVLGAIQRLHWALSRSPVVNPLPPAETGDSPLD